MKTSEPASLGIFDLVVAYRVYPGISKKPAVFSKDKLAMTELSILSFKKSCGDLKLRIIALLDGCPPEYERVFRDVFKSDALEIRNLSKVGNQGTFEIQVRDLANVASSDFVYFAEDDYFYREGAMQKMVRWAQSQPDVEYVTPYDHPDLYSLSLHRNPSFVRSSGKHSGPALGFVWKTVATTCLTFLARTSALKRDQESFLTYCRGNPDAGMWLVITHVGVFRFLRILKFLFTQWDFFTFYARAWQMGWKRFLSRSGAKLWSPVPTVATHLESTGLAPGAMGGDWRKEIADFISKHPLQSPGIL
ncbi:MAG: hypothetical protein JNL01_03930 [Bdellovibrionales bacterium]|nr:hypothetical protein [Bdellovibrionales bacterium]